MSIQDRARLIDRYLKADPETRKLIRDQAASVDAVTPLGPRLVDELDGLHVKAAA